MHALPFSRRMRCRTVTRNARIVPHGAGSGVKEPIASLIYCTVLESEKNIEKEKYKSKNRAKTIYVAQK